MSRTSAPSAAVSYKRHQFPAEVISHCVWRYHRFGLSLRDVQELIAARGIVVTSARIHQWCRKVGPTVAAALRRHRPRPGATWHVDEVQLTMHGRRYWLWRAVDQAGRVLDDRLVQARRTRPAAETVLRRVLAGCGHRGPRVIVTDQLASSPSALRRVRPGVEHRRHTGLNNRAEHAHRPTRRRERAWQRCTSPDQAQPCLSCCESLRGHFCPRRHLLPATHYRAGLATCLAVWRQVAGLTASICVRRTGRRPPAQSPAPRTEP